MIEKLASKPPTHAHGPLTMPKASLEELETLVAELGMGMTADYAPDAALTTAQADHRVFISEAYAGIRLMITKLFESDTDAFNALAMSGFLHAFFHIREEQCNQTTSQQLLTLLARIKPS